MWRLWWSLLVVLLLVACQQETAPDDGATSGPAVPLTVSSRPVPVTFATLNADPFTFLNRVIRVTGRYRPPIAVGCYPYAGPLRSWGLEADGFEMDVHGLSQVSHVADETLMLTVDGIWRRYDGPGGCGALPEEKTIWYLEAQQVVSPNPLGGGVFISAGLQAQPAAGGEVVPSPTLPTSGSTPIPSPTVPPPPSATPTATTGTVVTRTPFPSPNPTATLVPRGGGNGTTTPVPTPGPGTPSLTPTSTPTPGTGPTRTPGTGGGLGGSATGTPTFATPDPTSTPGPYGGPATGTPGGYP